MSGDGSCAALAEVHLQLHQKDASLAAAAPWRCGDAEREVLGWVAKY